MVAKSTPKTLEIRLKRFQPGKMETNRVCILVGKKGTGKSTLVEDIMWYQQNIPIGTIMSATEEANEAYSKMAPPLFIYKNFDADALLRLINRQKKMKAMYKQNDDYLPFDHRAFLLMDDCMFDKKNFKGPLVRELFMNGRHWDLFVLITMQYVMDITPEIRSNTDYLFALKENIRHNREKLYKEFFGVFQSFAVFDALYLEVTQDYRCLVLDNTVPSTNIKDCVFWYKAEKREPFKLGAEWYWDYSAQNKINDKGSDLGTMNHLKEMSEKVVNVVYEGQRQKPPPQLPKQPSRIQYSSGGPQRTNMPYNHGPQEGDYGTAYVPRKRERESEDVREYSSYGPLPPQQQQPQFQRAAYSSNLISNPFMNVNQGFGGFV